MSYYRLVKETGYIHLPGCFHLGNRGRSIPIDKLYPLGERVDCGYINKVFERKEYYDKNGKKYNACLVTARYKSFSTIRGHCPDCILKPRSIVVPIGKRACKGPLHPEGKILPIKEFHKSSRGSISKICRDCSGYKAGHRGDLHGYIPLDKVRSYLDELIEFYGKDKVPEIIGVTRSGLWFILNRARFLKKATVKNILEASYQINKLKEVA